MSSKENLSDLRSSLQRKIAQVYGRTSIPTNEPVIGPDCVTEERTMKDTKSTKDRIRE